MPGFLLSTMRQLLAGLPLTLELTALSVGLGFCLAVSLALLRRGPAPLRFLVSAYVFVFRGSPLLVQIFLIYYGLAQFPAVRESLLWPLLRDPMPCAVIALMLNTAAYGSEILRGGLAAVPTGAIEAGRVAGMSPALLYRRIVLPLAIRQALPAYSNEIIIMVKSTSLASTVTLMEVTGIAYKLISQTYRTLDVFTCAAAIYLLLNFCLSRGFAALERRLSPAQA